MMPSEATEEVSMLVLKIALGVVVCLSAVPVRADTSPVVYLMVRCTKAMPNKGDEYVQFMLDTTGKAMQVRADEGNVAGWVFARSVIPSGGESTCDYMQVNLHQGFPPERVPIDPYFVKAKVTISRSAWYAKLAEQSRLVRVELWRGLQDQGRLEKGSYFRVDYLKVPPGPRSGGGAAGGLLGRRQKEGETALRKGTLAGWQAQELVIPAGTSYPYNARTISVFADWPSIGRHLEAEGPSRAAPELVKSELFQVITVVRPASGRPAAR
jgi:hypothetical protein